MEGPAPLLLISVFALEGLPDVYQIFKIMDFCYLC